jgi:hypothetical protein
MNDEDCILLKQAACWGPGLRGRREEAGAEERRSLARRIEEAGLEVPSYLERPRRWVDRRAKLFQAGRYPDKGVEASPEALRRLAESFSLPVPVLIEHARSPLELGWLTDVRAEGDELFGTITLTEEADRLAAESGASSLSLGLDADLTEIREVSLVRRPRIPDAKLFSGLVLHFSGEMDLADDAWLRRWREDRAAEQKREAARQADAWLAEGRITPAELPFALAILTGGPSFAEGSTDAAEALRGMIAVRPALEWSRETAPAGPAETSGLDADAADFYRRRFSGLSLSEIARRLSPHT